MISNPHHRRYATDGSKSSREGDFLTDSDVKIWGSDAQQQGIVKVSKRMYGVSKEQRVYGDGGQCVSS